MTYPYGVHLAQVRIERDSCAIAVERFFVGYDVGRAVNPMFVEGQIAGGGAARHRCLAARGVRV
jgi:CO/xanthine dehydrogenase Mo-binding subunit